MSFERSLGPAAARKSHRGEPLEVESLPPAEAQAVAEAAANNASLQTPGEADQLVEQSPDSYFAKAWKAVRSYVIADPITAVHTKDRTAQAAEHKAALQAQRRQLFQAVARLRSGLLPRRLLGEAQFANNRFEVTIKDRSFRILNALDEGGQGQVFEVEDTTDHQQYIMKVSEIMDRESMHFSAKASDDDKMAGATVRRAIEEVAAMTKLNGEHCPELIDAQMVPNPDDPNQRIMVEVMKKVRGKEWSDYIAELPPAEHPEDFIRLTERVMKALQHIHRRGILHLDLKPKHIFIDDDDTVEFIDFGASYEPTRAAKQKRSTTAKAPVYAQRDPATHISTKRFAPPERKVVSSSYDVYSMGRTILFSVYGKEIDDFDKVLPVHNRLPEELKQVAILARKMTREKSFDRCTLTQAIAELHELFPHIFVQPAEAAKAEAS